VRDIRDLFAKWLKDPEYRREYEAAAKAITGGAPEGRLPPLGAPHGPETVSGEAAHVSGGVIAPISPKEFLRIIGTGPLESPTKTKAGRLEIAMELYWDGRIDWDGFSEVLYGNKPTRLYSGWRRWVRRTRRRFGLGR
jgi:hypothetical protein